MTTQLGLFDRPLPEQPADTWQPAPGSAWTDRHGPGRYEHLDATPTEKAAAAQLVRRRALTPTDLAELLATLGLKDTTDA